MLCDILIEESKMKKKRTVGIIIFGVLFMLPVLRIHPKLNYETGFLYGYSLVACVISFFIGLGILNLKEWMRKIAVYYEIITCFLGLVLLPLMYKQLVNIAQYVDTPKEKIQSLIIPRLTIAVTLEILFAVIVVYYFTRPSVKKHFE